MDRNDLTDVSSGCLPTGPSYTYSSGTVRTKIDYTLMNVVAASLLSSVDTRSMVDLNTSDHLPIVIKLKGACCLRENEGYNPELKVAWGRAIG